HQGRSAIKRLPLLPSFQLESKGSARACQPDGVNSQCLDQIELDLAQHLQWLNDLHWGAGGVECKGLAKLVDGTDMHPAHRGCAEVQGDSVGFLVLKDLIHSLA